MFLQCLSSGVFFWLLRFDVKLVIFFVLVLVQTLLVHLKTISNYLIRFIGIR
jgi:hypothetical protein